MSVERDRTSAKVRQIMAQLDELVDSDAHHLETDDAAAVRVFAHDARQALERLNLKLCRVTPTEIDEDATHT